MKIAFSVPLALFAALSFSTVARAHDIVVFAKAGEAVSVQYGHPGDWQTLDRYRILDLEARTAGGAVSSQLEALRFAPDGTAAHVEARADSSVIAARYDNGFWAKLTDGTYRNARRTELAGVVEAMSSFKYAKAWIAGDGWRYGVGHGLEILPLATPASAKPGTGFSVRVLWQGKPLAGVGVEIGDGVTVRKEADIPRFLTDAEGVASLPITAGGWQVIAVDHETPSRFPGLADKDRYVATFTFWLDTR